MNAEQGFFHLSIGYWQTSGEPPEEILATYPIGTTRIPLKPGGSFAWNGGEWVYAEQEPPPVTAPVFVTMRQARLALLEAGLLADVQTAIDALPSSQREAALIEWEFASEVRRDWPVVEHMQTALGLTDEQLDALFLRAEQL